MASDPLEAKLSSEDFDLSKYIRHVAFQYDSSSELKHHKKRVQGLADHTAYKLKQNVYKNYSLFIDTSREISSLESEMYQLSHLLHEHEVLMHNLQAVSLMEDRNAAQRENAEKHEKHSIASLLETVEGCSTVTEVPGRYLVHSSHLVELDQESYEAVHIVRAFLLNDSLMIGSLIKKRRGPVRYRFEALYELDNMAIVDMKDSDVVTNAFKVLMFPDSHLYQAENPESKKLWISLLELTKQKHKAARDAFKREADTLGRRRDREMSKASIRDADYRQAELIAADNLKDVPETLDVYVAQREFEQAVTLIEETKAKLKGFSDSHALRDVRARLNLRINQLSKVLMKELEASPSGSLRGGPRAARRAVGLLLRLGRSAKACELFLENHSQIILRDLGDVKMEGTTGLYIANLSKVFFTGLQNAGSEFVRAFGENHGSYSAFVVWCHKRLQQFTVKSTPVIFSNTPLSVVAECMSATIKECDTLNEIGVDLSFALYKLFDPHLIEALNSMKRQIMEQCALSATTEKWIPLDLQDDQPHLAGIVLEMENLGIKDFRNLTYGGIVDLSGTTVAFCKSVFNFVNDVFRFYVPELMAVFIDCFCDLFHHMVAIYTDALKRDENIPMAECIRGDAVFVVDTVLPTVGDQINNQSGLQIGELVELHTKLRGQLNVCLRERGSSLEPDSSVGQEEDTSMGDSVEVESAGREERYEESGELETGSDGLEDSEGGGVV